MARETNTLHLDQYVANRLAQQSPSSFCSQKLSWYFTNDLGNLQVQIMSIWSVHQTKDVHMTQKAEEFAIPQAMDFDYSNSYILYHKAPALRCFESRMKWTRHSWDEQSTPSVFYAFIISMNADLSHLRCVVGLDLRAFPCSKWAFKMT